MPDIPARTTNLNLIKWGSGELNASEVDINMDLLDAGVYLKPTPIAVTGSKGANAALTSLIAALVTLGLITDSTS